MEITTPTVEEQQMLTYNLNILMNKADALYCNTNPVVREHIFGDIRNDLHRLLTRIKEGDLIEE